MTDNNKNQRPKTKDQRLKSQITSTKLQTTDNFQKNTGYRI